MAGEIKKVRSAKAQAPVQFGVPTEQVVVPSDRAEQALHAPVAPAMTMPAAIAAAPIATAAPEPVPAPVGAAPVATPPVEHVPEPTHPEPTPTPAPPPAVTPKETTMADQFTTAADAMKTGAEQMKNTMTATTENAMSQGKATMEQIAGKSREAVEHGMKQVDELVGVARGNVEAMLAASRAATAGLETIAHQVADFSRKSFEETTAAARAMTTVKTPNELMQLQNDFAKTQFDHAISEMSKLSETMVKLMGEVFEPIQKSATVTTDKVKAMATSMGNANTH